MNLLNHDEGFFVWEVVIFLFFMGILVKKARKPLQEYLKERQKSISDSLAAMEMLKADTEQLTKESEEMKFKFHREISEIKNSAKEYTGKILWEAETEAKVACKIIIDEALSYVEKLKRDAINDLKSKTGKIVVEVAELILRKELSTQARQEEHIRELVKEINLKNEIQ
jgi:F-type H+-transporting ATPase subunit b